ncbi:GGDEF domain-containing protein [Alkaliphilus oremlandii]|uniref:Diguanylate cyclase/phosphodiesterase n=1 Tax=Alkaliphilus oremlandii (strain OhILAs) TaxID=350688 RepID=A8MG08_ALKOO|nr:GGDEF domain-containing protein [Alkaliphilus oremlandii]ABW18546.1 diguanylate cyclase/phosphodiesterase [Alkaliphilus oremlandii OhILAs]
MEINEFSAEDEIKNILSNIIKNEAIKTVFQPIISLRDASVFGYEALSRGPEGTMMQNPEFLFNCAIQYDMLWELELLCRTKSFEAMNKAQIKEKLFLNVNPNIINDVKFRKGFTKNYISKFSLQPENIIFEITEKGTVKDIDDFKKAVQHYKAQDYKIAIDDAGAGLSGLNMISTIHPHFIKLDMNLIRDVNTDIIKQALVKSMCEFATLSNTHLIAEGIETKEELLKLIEIGVHYGQGYFIQRPSAVISPIPSAVQEIIKHANKKKNRMNGNKISNIYINNICTSLKTLNSSIKIYQVEEMMYKDITIQGFCITENERVLGVITRDQLYSKISGQYGYSLYYKEPISSIMSTTFLSVDYTMPIHVVVRMAMQRSPKNLYDFITVTKDQKYLGIVTVKDLLENATQIEIINAKQLNPLSELPGNVMIEQQLKECIQSKEDCQLLYFDIDNFKAYNDVYGFEKGDDVIKAFSSILKESIPSNEFIGHIGGDDFIAIIFQSDTTQLCEVIIKRFDEMVLHFYNQNDLKRGYIITKNRHGIEETFPLLSISIVGIVNNRYENVYDVSRKASELKKVCKQKRGSAYLFA